jgi:cytosine/adenosine deaminase-related metal-dependent hydrolase
MRKTPETDSSAVLHRAAWVVPVVGPPFQDGAVLAADGVIRAVGPFSELRAESPGRTTVMDHGSVAIIPALVNAHTHLELTSLAGQVALPQRCFADWLRELMPRRMLLSPDLHHEAVAEGGRRLRAEGVGLCGDITNGAGLAVEPSVATPERIVFLEVLGFNLETLDAALGPDGMQVLKAASDQNRSFISLAAHACYSTSASLIAAAKEWSRKRGGIFSIHTAEHAEEIEFLQNGSGYCRELLENLGKWTPQWSPPRTTPVRRLEGLGVLDSRTLLVHAVHMTENDWEIVAGKKCSVCFCPRSNANIGSGRAAIETALQFGVTASLGTDSLASNTDLSLFAEAAYTLDKYPSLSPGAALEMITLGGARCLRQDARYGSIEPGKRAVFPAVAIPPSLPAHEIEEAIIHQGAKGEWQWVSCP